MTRLFGIRQPSDRITLAVEYATIFLFSVMVSVVLICLFCFLYRSGCSSLPPSSTRSISPTRPVGQTEKPESRFVRPILSLLSLPVILPLTQVDRS